jgi:hypothetical protein
VAEAEGEEMKRLMVFGLLVVFLFSGVVLAREYRMNKYVEEGLYPSDVIIDAIDSSAVLRTKIDAYVALHSDTVWRNQIIIPIMGINHDSVPVSAESTFVPLYVVPATGVTSVTIKNVSLVAERVPHTHATKIVLFRMFNMDATDSTSHSIINRCVIDTAGNGLRENATGLLVAYRPKALSIDSTANAVLYPNDAVWAIFYTDSANVYTKDLNVMLNLSIDK